MNVHLTQAPSAVPERRVYKIDEVAQLSGLSISTLKRRIQAGELIMTRLSPRRVGIRADHLNAWLDARAA